MCNHGKTNATQHVVQSSPRHSLYAPKYGPSSQSYYTFSLYVSPCKALRVLALSKKKNPLRLVPRNVPSGTKQLISVRIHVRVVYPKSPASSAVMVLFST